MPNYNSNASKEGVIAYLTDATELSRDKITAIVEDHHGILESGIRNRSYTNYVGDKIAGAAGLEYRDGFEEEETQEED